MELMQRIEGIIRVWEGRLEDLQHQLDVATLVSDKRRLTAQVEILDKCIRDIKHLTSHE